MDFQSSPTEQEDYFPQFDETEIFDINNWFDLDNFPEDDSNSAGAVPSTANSPADALIEKVSIHIFGYCIWGV
jgi:hypothetical protein